jgi:hypothetical protein
MLGDLFTIQAASATGTSALGGLDATADKIGFVNKNLWVFLAGLSKWLFSFLAIIFLILMILGGLKWMTSQGNDAEVKKAREIITTATIGLVVISAAYAITAFVGDFTLSF